MATIWFRATVDPILGGDGRFLGEVHDSFGREEIDNACVVGFAGTDKQMAIFWHRSSFLLND